METRNERRPLSPHLTIYRPQLTSVLSILHRITGLSLLISAVLVILWFFSIAMGEEYYIWYSEFVISIPCQLILILSIWAIWYHTFTGIRHLIWDTGHGFELNTAAAYGYVVGGASVVFTVIAWIAAYSNIGAM